MKKYDFKNKDDFRECERLAYQGTLDFSKFPPAAYRYFSELTNLYKLYKAEEISKADAENIKRKLLANYNEALQNYEMWCNDHKERQENIKQSDILRSDICKSDNIYVIADLAVKALMLMTGDTVVYKIFREKFGEMIKWQ